MKSCLCCHAQASSEAVTCASCGEGSFGAPDGAAADTAPGAPKPKAKAAAAAAAAKKTKGGKPSVPPGAPDGAAADTAPESDPES